MSTSYETSAMRSSFSLSSLRAAGGGVGGGGGGGGGGAVTRRAGPSLERPYHSLTKKRKEPGREAWRRSWGSAVSGGGGGGAGGGGDDLWPLLQHHYDYIMDNHLIDSCQEANGELSSHKAPPVAPAAPAAGAGYSRQWSLGQLITEFTDVCQWLTAIQEEIYSSPENLTDRTLRSTWLSSVSEAEWRRARFAEQAAAILERLPEAREDVAWRARHLHAKWEGVRLLVSPEDTSHAPHTVDTAHEMKCLRRWLHSMEGRLPPPSLSAARSVRRVDLYRRLREHQVLQRDVECHGRVVSSVVRLCGGADAARALERRWHLLYLRAIEWQCHLEACLARLDNQVPEPEVASDSDEEPALKQPRLCRPRTPPPAPHPPHPPPAPLSHGGTDSDDSYSEEEPDEEYLIADMTSLPHAASAAAVTPAAQDLPDHEHMDTVDAPTTEELSLYEDSPSGAAVVRRRRPVDSSRFNQTDRKSKNCATFYFKHHDTDSDRPPRDAAVERGGDSSEEEWTYERGAAMDDAAPPETAASEPPREQARRTDDIERLVLQAERLVQAAAAGAVGNKTKPARSLRPPPLEQDAPGKSRNNKMSRIKEWLQQNSDPSVDNSQCTESCDASGEYTTESDVERGSTASDDASPPTADTSACTLTPKHQSHGKVVLRKKRSSSGPRPWSVSCLAQVTAAAAAAAPERRGCAGTAAAAAAALSISESALHTLATQSRCIAAAGATRSKLQSSTSSVKTAVQGHISSSTTIDETCVSCYEAGELRLCSLRRKRLKLRRRQAAAEVLCADRLVKSSSFSGRLSRRIAEDKHERSAASDPSSSRKYRLVDTTSTSDDSVEEAAAATGAAVTVAAASAEGAEGAAAAPAPSFRLGPAGGPVRPRPPLAADALALSLGDPGRLWDLADKDSDVDRSVHTAGTEEHSSFSEQAWDFYQEKYNSEPYSEAPDSDAARRLLEFGDDYRAYLDSQSDCCSSLSQHEPPPPPPRHRRSPGEAAARKPKSMSSAERKKSLLDSLERSRHARAGEAGAARRRRTSSDDECGGRPDTHDTHEEDECGARALVRRSAARLRDTEALLQRDAARDLLRAADYDDIVVTCHENVTCLERVVSSAETAQARGAAVLSPAMLQEILGVSARWSALRAGAARRGAARRLRREVAALRDALDAAREPHDAPPPLHTKHHLNRRIDDLKERLARQLEVKVSMLKLTVSARRALASPEADVAAAGAAGAGPLAAELASLLQAWEDAHHRTSSELLSLEKALAAWCEWEAGLRELSAALRSDHDALSRLRPALTVAPGDKGGSTCGSLSDSGISDGDSEAAAAAAAASGARARRLAALRTLARDLQAALAPGSHAVRNITKRMEQAESEVRALQDSCRALVAAAASPVSPLARSAELATGKTAAGPGEPEYRPWRHWAWRALRSAVPFHLCLVALLVAAWLLGRPRCCDLLNSLAGSLTPQLRYVRGPPPV